MGARKYDYYIDFRQLKPWAVDLFAARNVLRWREWYIRSSAEAPAARLFLQVATALASGTNPGRRLHAEGILAAELLERHGRSLSRTPLVQLEHVCKRVTERCNSSRLEFHYFDLFWMDKASVRRDNQRCLRMQWDDYDDLLRACKTPRLRMTLSELGPLWRGREPAWLSVKWPSAKAQEREELREQEDDAEYHEPRGAGLFRSDDDLPERLRNILHDREFTLHYSATRTARVPTRSFGSPPGMIYCTISAPRKNRIARELVGRHRFRNPPREQLLEQLIGRMGSSPRLKDLAAFYRSHDGAVLFRPDGTRSRNAHVEILSLRDQEMARSDLLSTWVQVSPKDQGRKASFLDTMHCDANELLVFAIAGVSYFTVPLIGEHQGKVFRVSARAARCVHWAQDISKGLEKICDDLSGICQRAPLLLHVEGEPENEYGEFRLLRVTE